MSVELHCDGSIVIARDRDSRDNSERFTHGHKPPPLAQRRAADADRFLACACTDTVLSSMRKPE
jgi:hypothetical protein